MNTEKTILGVQYLRGFAALAVVLCHYASPELNFGKNGVLVFFLISGFIIVYSLEKASYSINLFFKFLLKRSIRIDPSYFVTIVLTILLFNILSFIPSFKGNNIALVPQQFLAHLVYVIPFTGYHYYNDVFWTLAVEFQFYIIIGSVYFINKSAIYKTGFLVLFSLSYFLPIPHKQDYIFTNAPVFALGISLVELYKNRAWQNAALPFCLLGFIGYEYGAYIFLLLLVSALFILFIKTEVKPMFLLGKISYSLYLTHSLCLIIVAGIFKQLKFDLTTDRAVWVCIEVSIALIVAWLFYQLIEKPFLKLSKKIKYREQIPRVVAA